MSKDQLSIADNTLTVLLHDTAQKLFSAWGMLQQKQALDSLEKHVLFLQLGDFAYAIKHMKKLVLSLPTTPVSSDEAQSSTPKSSDET